MPVLGGDSRSAWNKRLFDDPRVINLWDGGKLSGRWLADHKIGGLGYPGGFVWDAFFVFGPKARWQQTPSGLLAAGSPIIAGTGDLNAKLVPLLTTPKSQRH